MESLLEDNSELKKSLEDVSSAQLSVLKYTVYIRWDNYLEQERFMEFKAKKETEAIENNLSKAKALEE